MTELARARIRRVFLLGCVLLPGGGPAPPNAKAVERDLAKAVPLQSSPAQVLESLSAQKIEHSQYLRNRSAGNSILAVVRDRSKWAVVKVDVGIEFKFDGDDRLAAIQVRERYTGP